jgi:hypothetical protein
VVCDGGAAQVRNALSQRGRLGVTAQGQARRRMGGSCRARACVDSCQLSHSTAVRAGCDAIEAIISALQGCVVTKAEHQRLKPFDATHQGWA